MYSEATEGRGVSYERIKEWNKAEKDLLASLEVDPNQAYVINYLAYSWIEKGIKIEKSLNMLKKANKLKDDERSAMDFELDLLGRDFGDVSIGKETKNTKLADIDEEAVGKE